MDSSNNNTPNVIEYSPKHRKPKPVTLETDSGTYTMKADGVYFKGFTKEGAEPPEKFICAPLNIVAMTRNTQQTDWGYLLEWRDFDHTLHRWSMPRELLRGESTELIGELLRRGLDINHGKSGRLVEYIQRSLPSNRIICTDKTGWHEQTYITPDKNYGKQADSYIYQTEGAGIETPLAQAGSLDRWKSHIAQAVRGNSRLVFAISCAFAGTLLNLSGVESGGFHLVGNSSSGKSTAQRLAASVWGNPDVFKRSWRTTSNGLEGIASLHNDNILILDEISEMNSKDASETAYMLGNGQGKTRATKTGSTRPAKTWRTLLLSSGEVTLTDLLNEESHKRRVKAGQEIRMADIHIDAGKNMGIFEALNEFNNPAQFANALRDETSKHYGRAGHTWLSAITRDAELLQEAIPKGIEEFCQAVGCSHLSGQAQRVARRFALVAVAGTIATQYGMTGWFKEEANEAAKRCFKDWLAEFGEGNREERQIIDTVVGFIQRNTSLFQHMIDEEPKQPIANRVGFWRLLKHEREYIVPAAQLSRLAEGFNPQQVIKVLRAHKLINEPDSEGKSAVQVRVPDLGKIRAYRITLPTENGEAT